MLDADAAVCENTFSIRKSGFSHLWQTTQSQISSGMSMNLCDLLWSLLKLYFRLQRKTQTPNGIQRHNGSANLPLTHTWIAFPALWRGLISHSKPPQCRPFLDLIKMQPLLITEATLHSEVCVHRNRQNLLRDKIFSSGSVPVSDCSSSNTGHSLSRVCVKGKREARWQDLILK